MTRPSDAPIDEGTLEDLLWDLDVTTVRPDPPAHRSVAAADPVARPVAASEPPITPRRSDEPRAVKPPKPPRPPKRGRFHRPELESRWERISRNRVVQVAGGIVLLGGTAALVVAALSR